MNALVVYDSQFGNTERIAQVIASMLSEFGQTRAIRVDSTQTVDFQGVDLLILGCPTQGWRPTPAMQSFLAKVSPKSLSGLAVACFDTRFHWPRWIAGSAAERMVMQFRTMGVEPLVLPESFFVKGKKGPLEASEVERAARWALGIHQQYETPQLHLAAH